MCWCEPGCNLGTRRQRLEDVSQLLQPTGEAQVHRKTVSKVKAETPSVNLGPPQEQEGCAHPHRHMYLKVYTIHIENVLGLESLNLPICILQMSREDVWFCFY